jgi:hypothetical protein
MNGVGISDTPENAELRDRYRTDDEMKSVQNGTGRRLAGRCWQVERADPLTSNALMLIGHRVELHDT